MIFFCMLFTLCGQAQQKASKQNQKKSSLLLKKGLEKAEEGNVDAAVSFFNQSIELNPLNESSLLSLADLMYQMKSYDSTIGLIQKIILLNPSQEKPLIIPLLTSFLGIGDFARAKSTVHAARLKTYLDTGVASNYERLIEFSSKVSEKNLMQGLKIENLGSSINTKFSEYFPSVSSDDTMMIVTRRIEQGTNEDFFSSVWQNNQWQSALPLQGKINTPFNEGGQKISSNGKTMVFTGCNYPDGYGSCDLYYTINVEGRWTGRLNFGNPVNTSYWESAPCLSSDMKSLYFSSNRPGGFGGMDLYVSHYLGNQQWSQPQNLGPIINTAGDEMFPFFHFDNASFYFTSNGWKTIGGSDIFVSRLVGDQFTVPVNLGYPINTIDNESGLVVNASGKLAYFSSDRYGGFGQMDIYQFNLPEEVQAFPVKIQEKIILNNIHFETAKWELKMDAEPSLVLLTEFLLKNPAVHIQINGHTDNIGNESDNTMLSTQRAKSVVDYLIAKGIDSKRLAYKGFGSLQPIAENQSEVGRAKNRRTEMVILSNE
jgi:outer membrane protein OmpA-like peptidoglycan-associated protein